MITEPKYAFCVRTAWSPYIIVGKCLPCHSCPVNLCTFFGCESMFSLRLLAESCIIIVDCTFDDAFKASSEKKRQIDNVELTAQERNIPLSAHAPVAEVLVHFDRNHEKVLVYVEIHDVLSVEICIRKYEMTLSLR